MALCAVLSLLEELKIRGYCWVKANKWGENRREGIDNGRHVICGMNGRNDNYEYAD